MQKLKPPLVGAQGYSRFPLLNPWQGRVMHAEPAARVSVPLISALPIHSSAFFFTKFLLFSRFRARWIEVGHGPLMNSPLVVPGAYKSPCLDMTQMGSLDLTLLFFLFPVHQLIRQIKLCTTNTDAQPGLPTDRTILS